MGLAKGNQAVNVNLNPEELETLTEEELKAKYEGQINADKQAAKGVTP